MSAPLRRLSETIDRHRNHLLDRYDVEELHQLRVNIRRLRVFLAHFDGSDALELRREWGRLMRFTNDARDWDTFIEFARESLDDEQFQAIHPALARHQQTGQALALQAIRSNDWEEHTARWHIFLDASPAFSQRDFEIAISAARERVGRAWRKTCDKDTRRAWHRLRIAIKALRYLLDSSPRAARDHQALIHICKELQTDLGDWHDTVVHARLLEELIGAGDMQGPILEATEKLAAVQAATGAACLARIRVTMERTELDRAK